MRLNWTRSGGIIVALALAVVGPVLGETPYETQLRELEVVRQRIIDERTLRHLPEKSPVREEFVEWTDREADELLAQEDGYWHHYASVDDPAISHNGAAWADPLALAVAYVTPGSRHQGSADVLRAVEAGLRHLLQFAYPGCPQPRNWWAWQIGTPRNLLATLLLLEPALDRDLFQKEVDTLVHLLKADKDLQLTGTFEEPAEPLSGNADTNALWREILRLELGVLLRNPAAAGQWAHRAFGRMGTPGQGHWQADGSFKFHGPAPMWAYGESFLYDYAALVRRFRDTSFGPQPEQVEFFAGMATGYVQGFLYRGRMSPAMIGRTLTRGDAVYHTGYGPAGVIALASIAQAHPAQRAVLAPFVARERRYFEQGLEDGTRVSKAANRVLAVALHEVPAVEPAPPPDDVFAYPDSDFLQVTRPGWAVGIKMHSQRNHGYESINEENLQGWFLSHGSMFHLIHGREWDGCWPTLDWTRLPGTTVAAEVKKPNTSPFVGVLRGSARTGMAAMALHVEEFRARKSWLVHGDEIVCLGSDIAGPGRVETTVFNQPVAADAVLLIDGEAAPAGPFEKTVRVGWLWLEGVGYVFPGGQEVLLIREARTSDWSSVRGRRLYGESPPMTHHYLTAVIRHDAQTTGYAYVFAPGKSAAEMPTVAAQAASRYRLDTAGPHRVATADQTLEAVVLWEPGEAGEFQASRGCLLLRSAATWQVADPAWIADPLELRIGERSHRVECTTGRSLGLLNR